MTFSGFISVNILTRLWAGQLRALSLGVEQLGCEAECLPPSSAEIKNAWSYTSISLCLNGMLWCSIKAQGQLNL